MKYTTGQKGIDLIKTFERCRLTAYKCPAGVLTIGYGHTSGVTSGQTISQVQAETFLKSDLSKYENAVNEYVTAAINQNQFDALVSFAYNCGAGALKGSTLLKKLNAGDYSGAASEFARWNKASEKVLAGLVKRRETETELFNTATETTSQTTSGAPTYKAGDTYTLQVELKVRTGAGTNYAAKTHAQLSADGKAHDKDGDGALSAGTKVTCKEVKKIGSDIWMRTPSGWLAAYYKGNTYIK